MNVVERAAEVLRRAPKWNGTRFDPLSPMEAARALDDAGLLVVIDESPEHQAFVKGLIDEWQRNKAHTEAVLAAADQWFDEWNEPAIEDADTVSEGDERLYNAVRARREAL